MMGPGIVLRVRHACTVQAKGKDTAMSREYDRQHERANAIRTVREIARLWHDDSARYQHESDDTSAADGWRAARRGMASATDRDARRLDALADEWELEAAPAKCTHRCMAGRNCGGCGCNGCGYGSTYAATGPRALDSSELADWLNDRTGEVPSPWELEQARHAAPATGSEAREATASPYIGKREL